MVVLATLVAGVTLAPALQAAPLSQSSDLSTSGVIKATVRVNLRAGPNTSFAIEAKLDPATPVFVLGRNVSGEWYRVRVEATGKVGWVSAQYVQINGQGTAAVDNAADTAVTETAANRASATTTNTPPANPATPTAIVQPATMNVRGGPGTNYPIVTSLPAGTALPILAFNADGQWYQVQVSGQNAPGWVFASLTTASGPLDSLPRLSADQVPAPPTAPVAPVAPVAAAVAVASAPPPSGAGFFALGIQAHLWQGDKGAVAAQIKEIRFAWVKSQVRWEFVEDQPGNVNWSEPDQIIEVMSANGIQVLFSVFTAPQWARPDKPGTGGPPNDFNLYADFVGKMAQRYCGRLGAIEVWNEQNLLREWEGFPLDAGLYMDLLRRAYTAIKANCPSIIVVSGAPTPTGSSPVAVDDVDYLRGMYANGLARYSDAIGVHPSGFANPPEVTVQDWQQGRYAAPPSHFDHRSFYFRSTMEEYRNVMVANGDANKRLWPTEFGWGSTSTPHPGYEYEANTTEGEQAQFIVTAFRMMRDWGWVGVPFLWNLNFNEGEMAAFRVAGRPAYEALKSLTQ
jgi:uncharacterized protein YraI